MTELSKKTNSLFTKICLSESFHIIFLVCISLLLIFSKTWDRGLANYDDAVYAQKAKEILITNSWWTMHMHNNPAFDNPPFYMWLAALSFKVWGINDYAARFPSQLFGVLTIILIYFFAKKVFENKWTGLFSALSLLVSYMWICYSRHCMLDTTLSFFCTLALFSLYKAIKNNNHKFFILWGISISFCILTKSILGFFPLIISGIYLLLSNNIRLVWNNPFFIFGCFEILILGCFWYYHQYFLFKEQFISTHFGWLILERGLKKASSKVRYFSYVKDLFVYYLPLIPFFIYGLYKGFNIIKKEKNNFFILFFIWIFFIFTIMSLAKTHSRWYVLSAYPAIAVITGYGLNSILANKYKILLFKTAIIILSSFVLILNTTPLNIESKKDTHLANLISFIKTKNLENNSNMLIGYGFDFSDINCAFAWYADRATDKVFKDINQMQDFIQKQNNNKIFIISYKDSILQNTLYQPIYKNEKYILYKVSNS